MYLGFPLYGTFKGSLLNLLPEYGYTVDLQMPAGNWLGSFMDATWSRSRGWSYGFWDLNFC